MHPNEAPSVETESQDGKHDNGLGKDDDFVPICKKRRFESLAKAYDQSEDWS